MAVLNFDLKSVAIPGSQDVAKAVFLTGSIDASTNHSFETRMGEILAAGSTQVMLVLTNVKYINSTGLGTIVKIVDNFRDKGGDIKLVGVPQKVIALFEMLGLLNLFETFDNLETAVASFKGAKGGAAPVASSETSVKFPLQLKHPVTGMGLNVNQPGKFKDPRSGDYFRVDEAGKIEFYEMTKIKFAELRLPCDIDFSAALAATTAALAARTTLPAPVAQAMNKAIDEVARLVRDHVREANEAVTVFVVAYPDKLQLGFSGHGSALSFAADESAIRTLRGLVTEVQHVALPARGHLLTLLRKA
jgi:anti-sigma B factor antagonist